MPGFQASFLQSGLDALFDGQLQFAFGIVQFALLLDEIGLRLLSLRKFCVADFKNFLKFKKFARPVFQLGGAGKFRLPGLFRNDMSAFRF